MLTGAIELLRGWMLAAAVVLGTALGCMTELGPEGAWLHYEFADGFCAEGAMLGASVALGHCGEDGDEIGVPGIAGDPAGPESNGDEAAVGLRAGVGSP